MSSSTLPHSLDIRAVIIVLLQQFAPWLAGVLLITWAGYPGAVCITPLAWLIALRVGMLCVRRSSSGQKRMRLVEAALAGGGLGLLQGLLFWVVVPAMGPILPAEERNAAFLTALIVIVGMLAGAGLSFLNAYRVELRRSSES